MTTPKLVFKNGSEATGTPKAIGYVLQYSWPSRAWKKNSVGIFEYILASMLKVYLGEF